MWRMKLWLSESVFIRWSVQVKVEKVMIILPMIRIVLNKTIRMHPMSNILIFSTNWIVLHIISFATRISLSLNWVSIICLKWLMQSDTTRPLCLSFMLRKNISLWTNLFQTQLMWLITRCYRRRILPPQDPHHAAASALCDVSHCLDPGTHPGWIQELGKCWAAQLSYMKNGHTEERGTKIAGGLSHIKKSDTCWLSGMFLSLWPAEPPSIIIMSFLSGFVFTHWPHPLSLTHQRGAGERWQEVPPIFSYTGAVLKLLLLCFSFYWDIPLGR